MYFGKKLGKTLVTILVIISFSVTALMGALFVTHSKEVQRIFQVAFLIKTQYLKDSPVSGLMEGAVRGMVESLEDPYSVYMDNEEFKELQRYIQGSIGGIGVYVGIKDKKLIVVSPIEGTPAYEAGLKRDDVIIKIDDTFTSELEYDEAIAMMRGEPGTEVRVGVLREGSSDILDFTLVREIIEIETVESQILPENKDIGYLRLKAFSSNSDEGLAQHLQELLDQGIKGLVLDLRDNSGGDLDAAVNIARHFVPQGPIVYIVDKYEDTRPYAESAGNNINIPLVVLVNGGSASASEVLAGAIKDTKAGTLIGERTFGKGIVQGVFPLGRGEGLKLTTSKYLTPDHIDIHEKGIEPDIEVKITAQDKEDIQLKKALEVLKEKLK